jgi:site-specific recombinase XerD
MLESYYLKPETIDRVRSSWIGPEVERYAEWLDTQGYRPRTVWRRVPQMIAFGEFARSHGATSVHDLPAYVEAFVAARVAAYPGSRSGRPARRGLAKEIRGPVEQMLCVVLVDYDGTGRRRHGDPFSDAVPGFFDYLADERGLRPASILSYRHYLSRFESFLTRVAATVPELSPALLSAFVTERSHAGLAKSTVRETCGVLKVFLRYAHRQGALARDLSGTVEWPQVYRLATVPRSITWAEVGTVLAGVDRRTAAGKRDYAILLLLVTYGLRAREVSALSLDDIDWKHERLAVPERKAGHSTAFPLSPVVGQALADYLRHARPDSDDRHVFFRAVAPVMPIGTAAVSSRARVYLLKAGVDVPRPGSHTLRHTCVQRLVDDGFGLKTIGDFVGHRSARSTEVYAKVDVENLRTVALGDGEEVLR